MMKFLKKSLSALALAIIATGSVFAVPGVSLAQTTTQPVTVTPTTQNEAGERPVFIPLTNLPGLQEVADSESLAGFFNQLYRLCIGAAAVIAVLQIMRAGAIKMFNAGSTSKSQQTRDLIQNSVLGLLLVLSPAIVFGIINPDILDISLDFGKLAPEKHENVPIGTSGTASSTNNGQGSNQPAPQPSTNQLLTTEYEWRFLVKNANGGLISSIPGQTWPARGQGIWGARYPNKQACMEVQEGFLTWIRDNRAESNWTVDTSICNCSQPRGEFAQCRQ